MMQAQTSVTVTDEQGKPIDQVNVFFGEQNILVYTDKDGKFLMHQNVAKNSCLHFFKQGYKSKLVKYNSIQGANIVLEKLHVYLDEVGISESFSDLGNTNLTNIEKKSLEFLNNPSMAEGIIELSGVDMISSGIGIQKIVVRGLSGMRVVTYLNGMQINNQQWANDHGIGFTDLGISEVQLIKGSSALKYGSEAIGGLLYFKDSPFISSNRFKGFVATKFNNSSYLSNTQFGIKSNYKNIYLNLFAEYSLSADYRLPNNDYLFTSRFKQSAIKFSIAHRLKKLQNIFRYHFHTDTTGIPGHIHGDPSQVNLADVTTSGDLFEIDYEPGRPCQFSNNQLFTYEMKYFLDNLKFSLFTGHFINHLIEYEKWTRPAFDLTLTTTQIRPNIMYHFGSFMDLTLNIGTQISLEGNKNNVADEMLMPDASSVNLGSYAIIDYEKNNFGFNAGLRYDKKQVTAEDSIFGVNYDKTFSHASLSTGFYYDIGGHILRATYSGAYRAPHFAELFSDGVHHGTNRYEIGDATLNIEYANQIDIKYQWSNNHFGFVLNPFVQYISDFISLNPADSTINGYKMYNYVQYEKVELNGVEMNLHYHPHQLHNLHFEQSYSFLQAINKDSDYGLALMPANSVKTKMLFDFMDYENLNNFGLDYFSLYHIHKFEQDYFAEYETATESYNVINLALGFKFGNNDNIKCIIGAHNILNEEYSPHISRVRGIGSKGVPNPGRFFHIKLKYEF